LKTDATEEKQKIERAFQLARVQKPAYGHLYDLLEGIFQLQADIRQEISLKPTEISQDEAEDRWRKGNPLLRRWDFPIDSTASGSILLHMGNRIPGENVLLKEAHGALCNAVSKNAKEKDAIWRSFLHHEMEPWGEWVDTESIDLGSLLFLARSCIRPSIEWTSADILSRYPFPKDWLKGYCFICGSQPSLLFLEGDGERKGYCSWCGSTWGLHRFQCPSCNNRLHDSMGYLQVESEPLNKIQYCNLCSSYYKLIDAREMIEMPYFPLEEWTTLHLDLIAQRAGWKQPPSPSPQVYGKRAGE
jgi:FdhE protein